MDKGRGMRTNTDCTSKYMQFGITEKQRVILGLQRENPGRVSGYTIEDLKCHVKEFGVDLVTNGKLWRLSLEARPKQVCVSNRSLTTVLRMDLRKDKTRETAQKVTRMGYIQNDKGLD